MRWIGAALMSAIGLGGAAVASPAEEQTLQRTVERGPDLYRETVRTPPGATPSVSVTVEQKNWGGWLEAQNIRYKAMYERALRAEAQAERLESQLASLQGGQEGGSGMTVRQDERGTVITLAGSVLFPFDSAELLPSAQRRLDAVARALEAHPVEGLVIEGHTDAIGSNEYNQQLGEQRADAVKEYLSSRGVSLTDSRAVGVGESDPVATNDTAEGRANNRRVEIIIPDESATGGSGPVDDRVR